MRYTATPATATFFPVAAAPMKLPAWVPANVQRAATFWPWQTKSSIVKRTSGKPRRTDVTICFTSSGPPPRS